VALVNRAFAKKFFKGEDALGKHLGILDAKYSGLFEVVGVTEDTHYRQPSRPVAPTFFLSAAQWVSFDEEHQKQFENRSHYMGAIEIRTEAALPGLEEQVRRVLGQINPDLALIDFSSFAAQVDGNFTQPAMIAKLTSMFGLVALMLASIGLYGVTAYAVERRTSEIGIRMALGADPGNILKLVMGGAFLQIVIAMAIGIPATVAAGHAMAAQLFGVKPYDPRILVMTAMVLSAAALVAAMVPARRAAAIEPMSALRTD